MRVWMMKSGVCYLYATFNAIVDKLGLREADFSLTNKDIEDEQIKRHQEGTYDFQASPMLIVPLCSLYIINVAAFVMGIRRIINTQKMEEFFAQAFIPFFGISLNFYLLQGMFFRLDKGRISTTVTVISIAISALFLSFGSFILI